MTLEHRFEVNALHGSAGVTVPLRATPGRNGFHPDLSLAFGGGGNSVFGAGWFLTGLASIGLDTSRNDPTYEAASERYSFSGGTALVPALTKGADGSWQPVRERRGNFQITRFRASIERSFERFERWTEQPSGRVHWRAYSRNGIVSIFGLAADNSTRIADPAQPDQRTFQWLLEAQFDRRGNAIKYVYKPEDGTGIDPSQSFEARRQRAAAGFAQRYLKRILYGNSKPLALGQPEPADNTWHFELVFDFGEHDTAVPESDEGTAWPMRPDPFSTCRPGFELRTYRLCRRVLMFHRFAELGSRAVLVGATELTHRLDPAGTLLERLQYRGYRTDLTAGTVSQRATAPLSVQYSQSHIGQAFEPVMPTEHLPMGVDGGVYQWLDLSNNGLPGILHRQQQGWYFKENLGGGRFGPAQRIDRIPAAVSAAFQLADQDGDGRNAFSTIEGREAGGYVRDRDQGQWSGFQTLRRLPRIDLANARVQWADLNGDGYPDLLIDGQDGIIWYPSEGHDAFADPVEIARPDRTTGGAPTLSASLKLNTFFADMTGDGRPDLVKVENGRIEYWPYLGKGMFGPGVVMEGAPFIDDFGQLDPARLRLVDLDGGGCASLLYLGRGTVRYWTNRCGNSFAPEQRITGLPFIDSVSSVQVFDFLGDGTRCLVWSSPLPGSQGQAIHHLRLSGPLPPRLLTELNSGCGQVTAINYRSSAQDYLRDAATGAPWLSQIPQHRMVVADLEGRDLVSGITVITQYTYHHGFFDNENRKFVGFGRVDTCDTELHRSTGNAAPEDNSRASLVRTWHHLGLSGGFAARAAEFYAGDAAAVRLPTPQIEDVATLSTAEQLEAFGAIAGMAWRQEVFALRADGTRGPHPLRVTENAYRVRRLQPAAKERDAVFAMVQSEQLAWNYDEDPSDPRVTHELVLQSDDFGNVAERLSLAYPRRTTASEIVPGQDRLSASLLEAQFLNIDRSDRFEIGIELGQRVWAISALPRSARGIFTREELLAQLAVARADPLDFHEVPDGAMPQARLTGWTRHRFWNDARSAVLPVGQIGTVGLLHHTERAVLPSGAVAAAYDGRVDPAMLETEARLVLADSYWWASEQRFSYYGPAQFFRIAREESPGGARQTFTFDDHGLLVVRIEDVFGNVIASQPDYQVLASSRITDANGNVSETRYDPLGLTTATALHGEQVGEDGAVHPVGCDPLAFYAEQTGFDGDDVLADPARFLQTASRFLHYELDPAGAGQGPLRSILLEREEHVHDGEGNTIAVSPIRTTVTYYDGLFHPVQTKRSAGPGPAVRRNADGSVALDSGGRPVHADFGRRWLASGHEVRNNKGWLVRQYEPWFSATSQFETDLALRRHGVSTRTVYDAVGRPIRHDFPDGSFATQAYSPWQQRSSDANDNVVGSAYEAARLALPSSDPERDALVKAQAHAQTPKLIDNDPLGRDIQVRHLGLGGAVRTSRTELDEQGLPARLVDARGLTAFTYRYDMLGRTLLADSVDAGEQRMLFDTHGRLIHRWDAKGHQHSHAFDANGRPTATRVRGPGGLDKVVEQFRYGDSPGVPQAALRNLRGALIAHDDEAGRVTIERRSMHGQVLAKSRQLFSAADAFKRVVDWSDASQTALAAERYRAVQRLDALGRPRVETLPDGTTREYDYAALGHLAQLHLTTSDGALARRTIVSDTKVNARGQFTRIAYGNGVETTYEHSDDTHRLRRLQSRRIAGDRRVYQDIVYTYDPVGNITRHHDAAQEPGAGNPLIQGLAVSPACEFTYDPWYRLIRATGRVHQALLEHDYRHGQSDADAIKSTRHIGLNNGAAVERYTRLYDYDLAGNLVRLRHQGASRSWTTGYWNATDSNRTMPRQDLSGIDWPDPASHFDANGNMIRLAHLRAMDWNHNNRLVRAVVIDRSAAGQPDDAEFYVYGGDGRRILRVSERLVAGLVEVTRTLFLDGCEIRRITMGGALRLERKTSHIADGARRLATLHHWSVDQSARETDDVTAKRLHYLIGNHLGSVSLELDEAGGVISYEEYFPYGGTSFVAGRSAREVRLKDLRYCGKCRDDMTGLYCYEFRYYAPFIGNWLSPDPIGPADGLNLYCFVHNNPIAFIDPLGLDTVKLASGPTGMTEAQAINYYNWSVAYGVGQRITDLRRANAAERAAGIDWILVSARPLTDSERQAFARARARGFGSDPERAEVVMGIYDALSSLDALTGPSTEPSSGGGGSGEAGGGDGREGGDGSSSTAGGGGGSGTTGTGPGAGRVGTGSGDGSTAPSSSSPGSGSGSGSAVGSGSRPGPGAGGSDAAGATSPGSGSSGSASPGRAGVPGPGEGARPGGTGSNGSGGDNDRPRGGGEPGGSSTATPPPGVPIGPGGIPWTPDIVAPSVNPEGGTLVTDPAQVHPGSGNGDPRGNPGVEGGGRSSPSGTEGTARAGTSGTEGNGGTGGAGSGAGANGGTGSAGGEPGGAEGGLIGGQGWLTMPSWLAAPINTVLEHGSTILDVVQVGLDVVGLIPGLGEIADGLNGLISLARGDYAGAALSFAAMIPFVGMAATAGKWARRGARAADLAGTALRYGDEAASVGGAVVRNADEAVSASGAVLKNSDEAAQAVAHNADEASFAGLVDVDDLANNPNVIDRLSRAREFDIGGYRDMTGRGRYGRVGDGLDSDEALQNAFVRDRRGVSRTDAILTDNPATALTPDLHRRISNLTTADMTNMTARQVLQHHLDEMAAFTPPDVLIVLERESLAYITRMGL